MLFSINEEAIMTNYIRQLKNNILLFLTTYIIVINAIFTQTAFSESLSSSEDTYQLLLVDELQADDFINQLSDYDHIEIQQLSGTEAQTLLSDNYQLINYSDSAFFDVGNAKAKNVAMFACGVSGTISMILAGLAFIEAAFKTTTKHNIALAVMSIPAGASLGCLAGLVGGAVVLSMTTSVGLIFDLFSEGKDKE